MLRLFGLLLFVTPATAQQPTSMEQALSIKLVSEINSGLQCAATSILLQQQITALQQKIKDLGTTKDGGGESK